MIEDNHKLFRVIYFHLTDKMFATRLRFACATRHSITFLFVFFSLSLSLSLVSFSFTFMRHITWADLAFGMDDVTCPKGQKSISANCHRWTLSIRIFLCLLLSARDLLRKLKSVIWLTLGITPETNEMNWNRKNYSFRFARMICASNERWTASIVKFWRRNA